MLTRKNILFRLSAFLLAALFVIFFLARELDRIQESGRILACQPVSEKNGWQGAFKTGFPGFSAVSFRLHRPVKRQSGKLHFELRAADGKVISAQTAGPDLVSLSETPVWLRFPAAGAGEWLLTIRDPDSVTPVSEKIQLNCTLYAGKLSKIRYWYGLIASGFFFLALLLLEWFSARNSQPVPENASAKKNFDLGIHYFRAFAIFCIMILHYNFLSPGLRHLNHTLFSSSSYFFVFISGYLFYYLTHSFEMDWRFSGKFPFLKGEVISGKFSTKTYFRKKLQNILLPYFLISSILYLYILLYSDTTQFVPAIPGTLQDYWFRIRTGAVQRPYWYIYFISKIFLISPLLLFLPRKCFTALTLLSCALPFFFDRTASHLFYFLPMYLLGIWYARNRTWADRILFKPAVMILIAVLTLPGLFLIYQDPGPQNGVVFLTRLLMTVLLLYLTSFLSRWKIPALSFCADISFTLFFIHDFIFAYMRIPVQNWLSPLCRIGAVFEILVPVILIAATGILAAALKCLFGRFSRRFIGS